MAIPIVLDPDPILRKKSRKVKPKDKPADTAQKMIEAAVAWQAERNHETAVALAAPQIGVGQNIVIIRRRGDKDPYAYDVYFNVRITKHYGDVFLDQEGCLSVKDKYAATPRYDKIKFIADDINFKRVEVKLSGFPARVMQHEVDHLHGTLFYDHKPEDEPTYRLGSDGKMQKINDD